MEQEIADHDVIEKLQRDLYESYDKNNISYVPRELSNTLTAYDALEKGAHAKAFTGSLTRLSSCITLPQISGMRPNSKLPRSVFATAPFAAKMPYRLEAFKCYLGYDMAANFHEHFEERVERPSDRSTGLVFASASVVFAVIYHRNAVILPVGLSLALLFLCVSVFAPYLLRPLNIVWFGLGLQLQKIIRPLVMAVLFLLIIVPVGLIMRLRYDPLRAKIAPSPKSYWIERERSRSGDGVAPSMRNQF